MISKNTYTTYLDFIEEDRFIEWRLFRTDELESYWQDFQIDHPEYVELINEAIKKINIVQLNKKSKLSPESKDELYDRVLNSINHFEKRKTTRNFLIISVAAASIAILMMFTFSKSLFKTNMLQDDILIGYTRPSENVRLISGVNTIQLDDNASIKLSDASRGQASIAVDNNEKNIDLSRTGVNRLIVPSGKRSFLVLSDGTKVWINSNTVLEFPTEFMGKSREIRVKGEIFLDVKKSKTKPFYVHTSAFDVRVYGTKFNVSAYSEDAENYVVLVDGSVMMKTKNKTSIILDPNDKVTLNTRDGNSIKKEKVNIEEYVSWKDGFMVFNDLPMSEMLKKIGRYYNVDFINISGPKCLTGKTCSGKLYLSSELDSVMVSVSSLSSAIFRQKDSVIYMTNK